MARCTCGRFVADAAAPADLHEPARAPSAAADVLVPLAGAAVTAASVGLLAALAWWLLGAPAWSVIVAGCVAFPVAWWGWSARVSETWWRHTTTPEPAPEPRTVRLELSDLSPSGGVRQMRILDLPIDDARLAAFARAATEGRSLAVHRWAPGTFTRGEYSVLTDELVRAGLMIESRGNTPRRLSAAGRCVLRRLG